MSTGPEGSSTYGKPVLTGRGRPRKYFLGQPCPKCGTVLTVATVIFRKPRYAHSKMGDSLGCKVCQERRLAELAEMPRTRRGRQPQLPVEDVREFARLAGVLLKFNAWLEARTQSDGR